MRQIKLDKENNSATLDLDSFFYPIHLVQQAGAAFENLASVSVKRQEGRIKVELKPKGKDSAEETALYFCNFVLGLKRELGENA
tara:strand:+ start:68 stop:319 length:252 start_codon:yes stop_codon:yes gene_type:complete